MPRLIDRFEQLLRIDRSQPAESLMRIRAVYAVGGLLITTQVINLVILELNYGRWVYDQTILLITCVIVAGLIAFVRRYKNTRFYAAAYSALVIVGTIGSAVPEATGINTAMLPFIVLGPAMCGFMAGRGAAIGFFAASLILLGFLYWVSLSSEPMMISGDYTSETNRFAQGVFALTVSTLVSVLISERIYLLVVELRETAERARRAEAAKAEFLATIGHEIRTPLNGVLGLAQAIRNSAATEREGRLAESISRSGDSLLRILNDLLDLSKLEAGKLRIEPRAVSPQSVADETVRAWSATAATKGVALSCDIDSVVPESVMLDDLRVSQILQNLVSNAVKFTDHGEVRLKLRATALENGRWRLEYRVVDSGVGIDDSMIERIFDRFDQGAAGTARRYGGTGLGLPICRELAQLLGGSIGVETTGAGGSTFLLVVTVDAVALAAAPGETAEPDAASFPHLRVLVAEDDEVSRMVMDEFLKTFGVAATFVADGQVCIEAASAERFDVIFVDMDMPKVAGDAAACAIRKGGGASAGAAIIAVTGDADEGACRRLMLDGIDDRIVKPVTPAALREMLRRADAGRIAA